MSHTLPQQTKEPTETAMLSPIEIYNTLTRKKEPFVPVDDRRVGIYLCGPTVYDKAHIGHMVGPVIFDTIKRYLTYCGYDVTWVVNITDVDDKLIQRSQAKGISMAELAEEMTADYLANLRALGVDQIDQMPKATEHIPTIIAFIEQLIDRGYAYEVDGDVFFDVTKDEQYGKLTNRSWQSLQGEGGEAADRKRHPADFALWKRAKEGEPSWESPWGPGRPGWHIECSAMSRALLGETFDIHGGGLDLVFPHHENEIAQSECCHGKPMARYWMHNGLLKRDTAGKVGGRAEREATDAALSYEQIAAATQAKESRSKGAGGLSDLIERFGGETIRFFLLRTHYRSTVVFSEQGLQETKSALETFYRFFQRYERLTGESFYEMSAPTSRQGGDFDPGDDEWLQEVCRLRREFLSDMDDDFNTGAAISQLFELVRTLNRYIDQRGLEADSAEPGALDALRRGVTVLRELSSLLGLFRTPPAPSPGDDDALTGKLIELLIEVRSNARARKDFATADQIRDRLAEMGVVLEDRPGGTDWRLEDK